MQTHQDILNELAFHFAKIKSLMDKYPDAIQILNNDQDGYHLDVNLSLIEILSEEERQNQE